MIVLDIEINIAQIAKSEGVYNLLKIGVIRSVRAWPPTLANIRGEADLSIFIYYFMQAIFI